MDARETPRALAIWVGLSPLARLARAAARVSAFMTVGRPPVRPCARAAADMVECFNEPGAGGGAAGDFVFEDPAAAGGFEGVALELGVLAVGGDSGVADEVEMLGCH